MKPNTKHRIDSPWPHRLAVLLVCATFPLIWVGGLVTTYEAGMAVPDWPATYGYNVFAYPWQTWVYGPWNLFIEHGHRLLGALAGLITIALAIAVFVYDRRLWMRFVVIAALALVIAQGVLGGQRVLLDERAIARIHACVGPAFFALCVALAVFTSRWWRDTKRSSPVAGASTLQRLALLTALFAFIQLVLGAHLRHVSVNTTPGTFTAYVWFHLLMAGVVAVHVVLLFANAMRRRQRKRLVVWPAALLFGLVLLQIGLGGATWVVKYGWPDWFSGTTFAAGYTIQAESLLQSHIVTAHVAVGSLILAVAVQLALRSVRMWRLTTGDTFSDVVLKGVAV